MTSRHLTFLAATGLGLALALAAAPAQAAQRSVADASGDAPARLDITRFTVRNTSARISAVVHVRDLRRTGTFQQRYYDSSFDTLLSYGLQVRRDLRGHLHVHAFRDDENGDNFISCPGVRARWLMLRDRLVTSMPVACATGVAFAPLHTHVVSFDPGDLGVVDDTRFFAVQRD